MALRVEGHDTGSWLLNHPIHWPGGARHSQGGAAGGASQRSNRSHATLGVAGISMASVGSRHWGCTGTSMGAAWGPPALGCGHGAICVDTFRKECTAACESCEAQGFPCMRGTGGAMHARHRGCHACEAQDNQVSRNRARGQVNEMEYGHGAMGQGCSEGQQEWRQHGDEAG